MFTRSHIVNNKTLKTSDKASELFSSLSLKDRAVCFNPKWTKHLYTNSIKNNDFFKTIYQNSENKILFDLYELLKHSSDNNFIAYLQSTKTKYDSLLHNPYKESDLINRYINTIYSPQGSDSLVFMGNKKIKKSGEDINEYVGNICVSDKGDFDNKVKYNYNYYLPEVLVSSIDKEEIFHYQDIPICYVDYKKIHKEIKGFSMCTKFFIWKEEGESRENEFYNVFKNMDTESVGFIEDIVNKLYRGAISIDLEDKLEYMYKSKSFTKESKLSNWGGKIVEVLVFNSLESLFAYELHNLKGLKRCKNCKRQLPKKYNGIYCKNSDNHECCKDRDLKRKRKSLGL